MDPNMMPGMYAPYDQGGQMPLLQGILATQPKTWAMMGFTSMRGSRAIRLGGWADGSFKHSMSSARTGKIGGGAQFNLNPRSWFRAPTVNYFNPEERMRKKYFRFNKSGDEFKKVSNYSPFNAAETLNKYLPKLGEKLSSTSLGSKMKGPLSFITGTDDIIDTGAISRFSAMAQAYGGAKINPTAVEKFIKVTGGNISTDAIEAASPVARAQMIGSTMTGTITGHAAGYLSASIGRGVIADEAKAIGSKAFVGGAKQYAAHIAPLAKHMAEEGLSEKFGEFGLKAGVKALSGLAEKESIGVAAKAGLGLIAGEVGVAALDFWNPIGWALTIKSIADLGMLAGSYGATTLAQAYGSQMKGLSRPLYGGAFQDTEASMTSRSRGVAAIQNSRLNARSILGSEASGMYQHFS